MMGAMERIKSIFEVFRRKRDIDINNSESKLQRCLSTLDLTALGIGSTLGVGVYVAIGEVVQKAGPSVTISFAIAAVASIFAALCYAEFGARVPKAGSAYVYSYVTVGEFMAFFIGWSLILEYVIGAASVATALSKSLDTLGGDLKYLFREFKVEESTTFLIGPLPLINTTITFNSLAFIIPLLISVALAFGAKESSLLNNFATAINLAVVTFIIIAGIFFADLKNWKLDADECQEKVKAKLNDTVLYCSDDSRGGFAPHGIQGIIRGAATCFYSFIGFDCIATAGEEAKNPKKSIPIAVVAALTVVFLAYFGVSAVITLVVPYYKFYEKTPVGIIFDEIHWPWAKFFVGIGGICALCTSLLGALFPMPRVIYAMASDGLIFTYLSKLHPRFKTPFVGTITAGLFTAIFSGFVPFGNLMNMMSIGALTSYSIVATCVLILRYEESTGYEKKINTEPKTMMYIIQQLVNYNQVKTSTKSTSQIVMILLIIYGILCIPTTWITYRYAKDIFNGSIPLTVLLVFLLVILISILILIHRQPVSDKKLTFSVPMVPFLPGASILINLGLVMTLDKVWGYYGLWVSIGFALYFFYGVKHSTCPLKQPRENKTASNSFDVK